MSGEVASVAPAPQHARIVAALGPARLDVDVTISTAALLAIAGIVGVSLIGSAAIVWAARRSPG